MSASELPGPEDERPPTPADAWPELPPIDGLLVPDDARELEAEAAALRKERRAAARRSRFTRLFAASRWRHYGLSGPMIAVALAAVAVFGGMLTLLGPDRPIGPSAAPLATTSGTVGTEGGLLPDISLMVAGTQVEARRMRPSALVLLPSPCADCGAVVRSISRQAAEFQLRSVLVAPDVLTGGDLATFEQLTRQAAAGLSTPATDTNGRLRSTYAATGVTVLVVGDEGVVDKVIRDVGPDQRLEAALSAAAFPADA